MTKLYCLLKIYFLISVFPKSNKKYLITDICILINILIKSTLHNIFDIDKCMLLITEFILINP